MKGKTPVKVEIRTALQRDLGAVAQIDSASFHHVNVGIQRLEDSISNAHLRMIVAAVEDEIVGFCVVKSDLRKPTASLLAVAVTSTFIGRGVGAKLVEAAEHDAVSRGFRTLRLEVRPDNRRAIRFYERAGYRAFGVKEHHFSDGSAAIRMRKRVAGLELGALGRAVESAAFAIAGFFRRAH